MEKLVPKLRFPEFKGNWEEKKFNSLYSFKSTNSFSRENLNYENGEVKNIHYGDIHTKFSTLFDITKEKVPFINLTIDTSKIKEDSYVEEGDLIIADASENYDDIGKMIEVVNVNDEKLVAGLHTFLAKRKNTNNAIGFTANLVKTWNVRQQILKIAQGTKVLSISTGRLGEILLTIPQPEEQQKIASFLTSVDERLTLLAQQKEKLELYKKGVMQQIFSQKLRFKDENGKDYPDWEEKKLGELCKKAQSGGTPKSTVKEYYDGEIPFLAISDMTSQGKYLNRTSRFVSMKGIENSSSWIVPENSLIYSMYASVGFVSINKIKIATSQAVMNIILKENINLEFVYYSLLNLQNQIYKFVETGTQGNINAQIVKNLDINLPYIEEQQKIASFLSAIDVQIEGVSKKIEQTKMFKKGLLQQLFV